MVESKLHGRKILKKTKYKKDIKRIQKRNKNIQKIGDVVERLGKGESLERRYQPHRLEGKWDGFWECHLDRDWLLIWKYDGATIELTRTGTHSDLFKRSK